MIEFSLQYEDGTPAIKSSIVTGGGEERLEREQAELRQGPDGLGIQGISEAGCHLYIVTAPACTKLSNGNGQSKAGEDHSILRDGLIMAQWLSNKAASLRPSGLGFNSQACRRSFLHQELACRPYHLTHTGMASLSLTQGAPIKWEVV